MRPYLFAIVLLMSFPSNSQTYFNNKGEAVLFYNVSKNIFFAFDGTPLYYISQDFQNTDNHVYNFNGSHIGWLEGGEIYNNSGYIIAFTQSSRVNILTKIEPIKGLERIAPIKRVSQIAPIKPLFRSNFTTDFFPSQSSASPSSVVSEPQSSSPYNRTPNFDTYKTKPYKLPTDAILNTLETLNRRHQDMIYRGYVLDPSSGTYMTQEAYSEREQQRIAYEAHKQAEVIEGINTLITFANSKDISFDPNKLKTGWYILPGVGDIGGKLMAIRCKIKKGTITRILLRNQTGRYSWKCNYLIKNKIQRIDLINKTTYTKGYFFYTLGITKG